MKKYAQIVLTNDEVINLELFSEYAPKTVENFCKLVEQHYYDGTIFHRVIRDFMIQTGGYKVEDNCLMPLEDTTPIYGEFRSNGYVNNTLLHELGTISMARTSDKNSATGQFFICVTNTPHLDGEYAAFGKTTDEKSNETAINISLVETCRPHPSFADFPVELIGIKTINLSDEVFK